MADEPLYRVCSHHTKGKGKIMIICEPPVGEREFIEKTCAHPLKAHH